MNTTLTQTASPIINPIDDQKQHQVIEHTRHYIKLGSKLFDQSFNLIPVVFDLRGRAAGMYKWKAAWVKSHDKLGIIRYNPWIFAKYYEESLAVTIPHEVAHYLVRCMYGIDMVRPHGFEWKNVMKAFGVDDSVTANFDMTGVPCRKHKKFEYVCDCRIHQLSTLRHRKCSTGEACYYCRRCRTSLTSTHRSPDA